MNQSELDINLKALKKVDPYIVSIEAHSGQVALYKYDLTPEKWLQTEVQGTLFVYRREAEPEYGLTIMNRLNMENLVEPITNLEFELQTPFLLYRTRTNDIFGIWFYERTECERVGKKVEELARLVAERQAMKKKKQVNGKGDLKQLFKSAEGPSPGQQKPPIMSSGASEASDTGRNLLRLLSQNDNGAAMGAGSSVMEGIKLNNNGPEKTSASVQDFFAKAVSSEAGSSAFTSVPPGPVTMTPMFSQSPAPPAHPIMALPISQGLAQGMVPVGGFQVLNGHPATLPAPTASSGPSMDPIQKLMSNPGIHSVDAIEAEQRQSISPPDLGSQVTMTPNTKKISDLESDLKKKLQIGSGRFLENNNDLHKFAPVQEDSVNGAREGHVKLLSPKAFSRPTASPSPPADRGVSPPVDQITPLTQGQLVEAMNFLLENDSEFVTKIHQAYVMSLNRKLSAIK